MAKGNWLFLHRSEEYIFYYRRAIPNSIRHAFGNRWEIKKSLKTRERSVAILRHNELNAKVERIFMGLKMGGDMGKDLASMLKELEATKKIIAKHEGGHMALFSGICLLLRGVPLTDDHGVSYRPLDLTVDGDKIIKPDGEVVGKEEIFMALKLADRERGVKALLPEAERKLNTFKPDGVLHWFDFDGHQYINYLSPKPEMGSAAAPAQQKDASQQPAPKPQAQADSKCIAIRFSEMAEKYLAYRSDFKPKTKEDFRSIVRVFIDLQGDLMSTELSHPVFSEYREKVMRLPSNFTKKYPTKRPHELLGLDTPVGELMTATTVNKYMSRISQICEWGTHEGYMEANFAANKRLKISAKERKEAKGEPFTHQELVTLFSSDIYKLNKRNGKNLEKFWLPLIALYTGMRIGEIAELQIGDVREVEDDRTGEKIWVFDINENGDCGKSVKNLPSMRLVPIHSELVKMGIMEHYRERIRQNSSTLWNLKPVFADNGVSRGYAHNIGRSICRYIDKELGHSDKEFHSFRHTAIKALRENADIREDYMKALVGHALSGTTGTDYFSGLGVTRLKETVEGITYPRLDLRHLYKR